MATQEVLLQLESEDLYLHGCLSTCLSTPLSVFGTFIWTHTPQQHPHPPHPPGGGAFRREQQGAFFQKKNSQQIRLINQQCEDKMQESQRGKGPGWGGKGVRQRGGAGGDV